MEHIPGLDRLTDRHGLPLAVAPRATGDRCRVMLLGSDARRLRELRAFLEALGAFEIVAVAAVGIGWAGRLREHVAAAVVVDDLDAGRAEQVIATGGGLSAPAPWLGVVVTNDAGRVQALYAAGAVEVIALRRGAAEIARALGRAIERQALLDRIAELEAHLVARQPLEPATGLYPVWRFEEALHLERTRARHRDGPLHLAVLRIETTPPLGEMADSARATALRRLGQAVNRALQPGDLAGYDGNGQVRLLLIDADADAATRACLAAESSIVQILRMSGIAAAVTVDTRDLLADAAVNRPTDDTDPLLVRAEGTAS